MKKKQWWNEEIGWKNNEKQWWNEETGWNVDEKPCWLEEEKPWWHEEMGWKMVKIWWKGWTLMNSNDEMTTGWKDDEMKRLAENMMKSHVKHRSGSKRWWNESPWRQKEIGWKNGENQWYINLTIGCERQKSWRAHVVLFNQRAVYLHCGRAIQKIGKEWIAFANGKIGKKSVLETKQLKGTCNNFQSSTCSLPVF